MKHHVVRPSHSNVYRTPNSINHHFMVCIFSVQLPLKPCGLSPFFLFLSPAQHTICPASHSDDWKDLV